MHCIYMPLEMVLLITKNRYYQKSKSVVDPMPKVSTNKSNKSNEYLSHVAPSSNIIELCNSW